MEVNTETIIHFIRWFSINMSVYYCFEKILNVKENAIKKNIILIIVNLLLAFVYVPIRLRTNLFWLFAIMYLIYSIVLSKISKNKLGYSMIITIISYAITLVCHTLGVVLQFIPYKVLDITLGVDNKYLSLIIILLLQFLLLHIFFRIKRFKNGFIFINNKLNNEITDIVIINISIMVILMCCLIGTRNDDLTRNFFVSFTIISVVMFITIQKMLNMYYKQKLLTDTMEEYKKELANKENEIESLKAEKRNISKITHEFYNRQKALELLVTSNMEVDNIEKENVSQNVLNIIQSLTNEYAEKRENIKQLPKLEQTDIPEIDNMFKYMQSECKNNNIEFKLKIMGNIHSLVNNIIAKNRLETLIGDHLRDGINAINLSTSENRELLVVLGIKNKKYEFSIYDTGVDFEVDTLVKLGLQPVTTNAARGGTGTGFMTTFETLTETKASLVITEYPLSKDRYYTKCVSIVFDGKNQYKIRSYRANEIKQVSDSNRIKIEDYK